MRKFWKIEIRHSTCRSTAKKSSKTAPSPPIYNKNILNHSVALINVMKIKGVALQQRDISGHERNVCKVWECSFIAKEGLIAQGKLFRGVC